MESFENNAKLVKSVGKVCSSIPGPRILEGHDCGLMCLRQSMFQLWIEGEGDIRLRMSVALCQCLVSPLGGATVRTLRRASRPQLRGVARF